MSIENRIDLVPPQFTVNLDLPPKQRWQHVIKDREDVLKDLARCFPNLLKQQFNDIVGNIRKTVLRPLCYMKPMHQLYSQELAGMATLTSAFGLTYGDLVLLNTALEYMSKCTSVVVSTVEGQIHGRTLDWDIPLLRKMTIVVTFKSRGQPLFTGVTFVGCVGLLTGVRSTSAQRDGGFSISYNYRKPMKRDTSTLRHILKCYGNRTNISFTLREILATCVNYEQALQRIRTQHFGTNGYIILSGVRIGQGMILAVGRHPYHEEQSTKVLVQTNHDRSMEEAGGKVDNDWAEDDPVLLSTMERKSCLSQFLSNSNSIDRTRLEEAMLRPPVTNATTIFMCTMKPSDGDLYCILPSR